jgi:hypothetical protein
MTAIGRRLWLEYPDANRMGDDTLDFALVLTFWLARFLEAYVFGITVHDPITVSMAALAIASAALLASARPALRAANVDPARVLRAP